MVDLVKISNSFVPKGERFTRSFTWDYYIQGLRRLIKWLAEQQGIGCTRMVPLDPIVSSDNLLLLLCGHSNRSSVRYHLIRDLLEKFSNPLTRDANKLMSSGYYEYIFKKNEDLSIFLKYKNRFACLKQVKRVLALHDYFIANNNSFSGFTNSNLKDNIKDYPLCLSFQKVSNEIAEFDGSHRRCVAYFCGSREIASRVIDMEDLDLWFHREGSPDMYFKEHWGRFKDIIYGIGKINACL
jgi:hypothetical protein